MFIDINKTEIEVGWEWFVFKKRSQRAQKQRSQREDLMKPEAVNAEKVDAPSALSDSLKRC